MFSNELLDEFYANELHIDFNLLLHVVQNLVTLPNLIRKGMSSVSPDWGAPFYLRGGGVKCLYKDLHNHRLESLNQHQYNGTCL